MPAHKACYNWEMTAFHLPKRERIYSMSLTKLLCRAARCAVALGVLFDAGCTMRAQQALTWDQVKAKFEAANPVLKSDQSNVDETKAEEITA